MVRRLISAGLLVLAGPALASPGISTGAGLAAYLKARIAAGENLIPEASRGFAKARAADPGASEVRVRTFETALVAGDRAAALSLASALAPGEALGLPGSRFGFGEQVVQLAKVVGAAHARDWRAFDRARAGFQESQPGALPLLPILLESWGKAARGDIAGALAPLSPAEPNPFTRSYFLEHRAHILAFARRWPEAFDGYARLVAAEGSGVPRLRLQAAAAALEAARAAPAERDRWREKAIGVLGGGPAHDPLLAMARARLAADPRADGRRIGAAPPSVHDGLAQLFLRLAADASRERPVPVAIAFARFATFLAPASPEAWLLAGDMLARNGLGDLALSAYASVPAGPYARQAAVRSGQVLVELGRTGEAIAALRALATGPEATVDDWVRLSDVQRGEGDNAGAAQSLDRAVALLPQPPAADTAYVWFLRGSALERSGDFARAEPDLRKAVELQPENAIFLNYLGYSLLDRGLALDEAETLIARALKAQPENGAIIDSMGWSRYVRGDYAAAVELLEKARAAEPADPTIADHLGDALWRTGRRIEARHAWAAALALDPDDALKATVARKIEFGLEAALARR
ncbi:tetratricopeptide repeat protein [Thermaurantiacus sp.]